MNKSAFVLLLSVLLNASLFAQAQLIFNGVVYMNIDQQAKLVIDNPGVNGIVSNATGGIISESEFDQVKWNVGTSSGLYSIPFVAVSTLESIPFEMTIAAGGTAVPGSGNIWFSTYNGANWNNDSYRPTDVTHMFDFNSNSVNNSNHVIDRFWIIDAQGYTVKPTVNLSFTYQDLEHTQAGNAIIESALGAQRFHPGPNLWGDYLPQGITNTALNTTSNVPVSPTDFWRSWTLSETTNPLAVELTAFNYSCNGNGIDLIWNLAYELNTNRFEVQYYHNGVFETIQTVYADGSNQYETNIEDLRTGLIQLIEIDIDGNEHVLVQQAISCEEVTEPTIFYDYETNQITIELYANKPFHTTFGLHDAAGRLIYKNDLNLEKGSNKLFLSDFDLSTGLYFAGFVFENKRITKKIIAQ